MTPELYQSIREHFDAVIDLPADQRLLALQARRADQRVISAVMELIDANARTSNSQISSTVTMLLSDATNNQPAIGGTLGVWKTVREIGRGGMGSVYLVERSDGHFKQTAALKFLLGLPSGARLNFFARERQLLATLTHPNIARLLDGGATATGQPYLVMEYIDGVAIDIYCQQQQLTSPQILTLFTTACDAVAFAHRQLIVHCDLKPSNLLVNREGRPILLDFGIARLVDRVGADETNERNAAASRSAYTPRYASPEQREQDIVTTVSDIFSLGVMLGELLKAASGLKEKNGDELHAIVAKATAASPDERYATVDALTDDINRLTHQFPVHALPHTTRYTAQKFLQRRWPLVLASFAFVATVAGFTFKVVVESQRAVEAEKIALAARDRAQLAESQAVKERDLASHERDRATSAEQVAEVQRKSARDAALVALNERDLARSAQREAVAERNRATSAEGAASQTRDFLISVFKGSNPNAKTGEVTASTLLAEAEARIESEMRNQPQLQGDLYLALADVQKNMGNLKQSREAYQKAVALARQQNRPLVLAQTLRRQALLDMSAFGGKEALKLGRESLALSEQYAKPDSEDIAHSLNIIGYATFAPKEAEAIYLRALAIRMKLDPLGDSTESTLVMLGHNAGDLNKYEAALSYYQRALALNEKKWGPAHPQSIAVVAGIASAQLALGKLAEAETNVRRNVSLSEKIHGTDNTATARQVAALANLFAARGRQHDALAQYKIALAVFEKKLGRESASYILALCNMAQVLADLGNSSDAVTIARESFSLAQRVWSPTHPAMAIVMRVVGRIFRDEGDAAAALPLLRAALRTYQQINEAGHATILEANVDLGLCYAALGMFVEANTQLNVVAPELLASNLKLRTETERARALIANAQGNRGAALQAWARHEQLVTQQFGEHDSRSWLAKMPRAELLGARDGRGDADANGDRGQSKKLALQILDGVTPTLVENAPVLEKLRRMLR